MFSQYNNIAQSDETDLKYKLTFNKLRQVMYRFNILSGHGNVF